MRLTVASIHALLASGALAASIDPRNIQTAQQCLGKIQSAEEAMNTAINGLNAQSNEGADAFSQSIQGAESALDSATQVMKGAQAIGEADAQSLVQSVESMASSMKLTAMSLVLQQPTIATLGLTNAVVQSLTVQRQQLAVLTQTVVTKVTPVVVPVVQVGLGQAVSAIDVGLGMMNGQGKVSVEMSEAGQVPAQGEADIQQQCLDAGFVQAGQEEVAGQQPVESAGNAATETETAQAGAMETGAAEAGMETQAAEAGMETQAADAEMATQEAQAGMATQEAEAGAETQEAEGGMEAQEAEGGMEAQEAEGGMEAQEAEGGMEAQEAEAGMETQEAEAGMETQEAEAGVEAAAAEDKSGAGARRLRRRAQYTRNGVPKVQRLG